MMDPILDEFEDLVTACRCPRRPSRLRDADRRLGQRRRHAGRATGARSSARRFALPSGPRRCPDESAGREGPIFLGGRSRQHARDVRRRDGTSERAPRRPASRRSRGRTIAAPTRGDAGLARTAVGERRGRRLGRVPPHRASSRVSLPTYPFERQSYWIGARPGADASPCSARGPRYDRLVPRAGLARGRRPLPRSPTRSRAGAFWSSTRRPGSVTSVARCAPRRWREPIVVRHGTSLRARRRSTSTRSIRPSRRASRAWRHDVCASSNRLAGVIDCWSAAPPGTTDLDAAAIVSLLGPLRLAPALSSQATVRPLPCCSSPGDAVRVHDDDPLDPAARVRRRAARR